MKQLTILYDSHCGLCCRATDWLGRQASHVALRFLPAGFARARELFPDLDPAATLRVLHVVADDGRVWRGARAWLVCLWALRRTRGLSLRLATPAGMAMAERVVKGLSEGRYRISEVLRWKARPGPRGAALAAPASAGVASEVGAREGARP